MSVVNQNSERDLGEPAPIPGQWRKMYLLVIIELAVVIVLLYALSRWAS